MKKNSGVTLIENLAVVTMLSVVALALMPFASDGKRMLQTARLKQECMTIVQSKLRDYRSPKIWAIDVSTAPTVASGLVANNNQPSGAFVSNSSFNWLKARYNLVRGIGGCVDTRTTADAYGLRENIDNFSPVVTSGATPAVCPGLPGMACKAAGPTDLVVPLETGGVNFAVYTNMQVFTSRQTANPYALSRAVIDSSERPILPDGQLGRIYNGAGLASVGVNFVPLPGASNCKNYPALTDTAYYDGSAPDSPYRPFPNQCATNYDFTEQGAGIRVVVRAAAILPDAGGLLGFRGNRNLPGGLLTNDALMCQAEEVFTPDESFFRFYMQGNQIFDRQGTQVFNSITNPSGLPGPDITAFTVSPDNSLLYIAQAGLITQFFRCGYGVGAVAGALDCDPTQKVTWSTSGNGLNFSSIYSISIDFNNYPDVMILNTSPNGNFVDIRFQARLAGSPGGRGGDVGLCGFWSNSARLANRDQTIKFVSRSITSLLISPLDQILFYIGPVSGGPTSENGLYLPGDFNLQFPTFSFDSVLPVKSMSQ